MYRYSWLPLNYRIFGLNHRKYQWNDYVSLACGARRACVTSLSAILRVHPIHAHASSTNITMRERSFVAMLHQRSRTKGHHACAIRPLSHGTSVNKQGSFHTREWTRFQAKNYASVRFCRRSRPTTKFLNVCENFARHVGHVKHYCPFTRSSFCNISQTLRKFRKECKECWSQNIFFVVWKGLKMLTAGVNQTNCESEALIVWGARFDRL